MAQNFPNNPTIGEFYTQQNNRFQWNGSAWDYFGTLTESGSFQFMPKVSARVNAGTYVVYGNFAWSVWTAANRSLVAYSTLGTSRVVAGSTKFYVQNGTNGQNVFTTINTTPTYISGNYHFSNGGQMQEAWVSDQTDFTSYHVTMLIGSGWLNNIISIEKLN